MRPSKGSNRGLKLEGKMPMRLLGRTGVRVSALGIGGYHLGECKAPIATQIVHTALEHGVTFFDNAWDYHRGESERRLGRALKGKRNRAFVMTKVDGQTRETALEQLEQSLKRLQTDHLDLVQMHEIIRPEDPRNIFSPGGAIEGLLEARKAGKLRFIGFTGHKSPAIHLRMLDEAERNGFRFDTVQMPLNVLDHHYASFEQYVLPRLKKERIGVLGMKSIGAGAILESGKITATECLRYALGVGSDVTITGCETLEVLHQALSVALDFRPATKAETALWLKQVEPAAREGKHEPFKTTHEHDSTWTHPEWLGLTG
jgi:aryl-alcohol dehydrogenase-like predicted oxidoreductase